MWHEDVVEDEFAGVGAAHAELVEFARAGEPLGCGGDDESCDAFGAFLGFCLGVDNYRVCIWALFLSTGGKLSEVHAECGNRARTFVIHIFVPLRT